MRRLSSIYGLFPLPRKLCPCLPIHVCLYLLKVCLGSFLSTCVYIQSPESPSNTRKVGYVLQYGQNPGTQSNANILLIVREMTCNTIVGPIFLDLDLMIYNEIPKPSAECLCLYTTSKLWHRSLLPPPQ
jgi:hypothetical protein